MISTVILSGAVPQWQPNDSSTVYLNGKHHNYQFCNLSRGSCELVQSASGGGMVFCFFLFVFTIC